MATRCGALSTERSLRTIAMRMNSANQPSISARAALTVSVTSAVRPMTHRQYGLPSNSRPEIARSLPAKISKAPTAPIEMSANGATPLLDSPPQRGSRRGGAIRA
jgi:hypothetical protein